MLDSLKVELAALRQFLDLLQQEQAALTSADVETLLALSDTKLKQADQLNRLAHQRLSQLSQSGFAGDSSGMEAWIAGQPEPARSNSGFLWSSLLEAARTARQVNQTNGKLIELHLQHNQQALNALANAANQASVYGPDGQPQNAITASGRTFGKA